MKIDCSIDAGFFLCSGCKGQRWQAVVNELMEMRNISTRPTLLFLRLKNNQVFHLTFIFYIQFSETAIKGLHFYCPCTHSPLSPTTTAKLTILYHAGLYPKIVILLLVIKLLCNDIHELGPVYSCASAVCVSCYGSSRCLLRAIWLRPNDRG